MLNCNTSWILGLVVEGSFSRLLVVFEGGGGGCTEFWCLTNHTPIGDTHLQI